MSTKHFNSGDTVYCRFTGEVYIVTFCDGCVAVLRIDGVPGTFARIVGDLTRKRLDAQDDDFSPPVPPASVLTEILR